ncbi:MAG: 3D-(3,5/4)-trihydroxycyclohexane-1,2-dione acylhydrolase (decyclizing) [Acidimicrobiia bacterium]
METVRLTTAQALVRWMLAQRTELDGRPAPIFGGVFAIFGHGNVVALAEALQPVQDSLPTWRGHNEQSMALAAIAYAKAMNRRQIMVATSSIGPGSTNMVTAAAVAHANRLPVLLISGDTFQHRLVDPVLQQVEVFGDPTMTVSDAFRPVTRYWDRITHPAQILQSLPQALAMMLDPSDCGPAYIALPQDIAAEAFDYPAEFFTERSHIVRRPGPDPREVDAAIRVIAGARNPLIIAGGGVHYSGAVATLTDFAERRGIPVTETVAGKSTLLADHPNFAGPIGVTGSTSANLLAAEADVVLAIGTRLQDFTTGSWSVFRNESMKLVAINAARFDAHKHRAISVVGDARVTLEAVDAHLGEYAAPTEWLARTAEVRRAWYSYLDEISAPEGKTTYAKAIRAINEICDSTDYLVSAAGGLPGELNTGWHSKSVHSFDSEYGYSTMGYEIAGAWGAKMALPDRDVICWTGDGSYLMMNSDIYSTVMTGHKVIFIVCDNGGFAVINRLQVNTGGEEFNNLLRSSRHQRLPRVDFAKHAEAMGAIATKVETIADLKEAFTEAKKADRSSVIVVEVDEYSWTGGGAWWEVGVPEVSDREQVRVARAELEAERKHQRVGI